MDLKPSLESPCEKQLRVDIVWAFYYLLGGEISCCPTWFATVFSRSACKQQQISRCAKGLICQKVEWRPRDVLTREFYAINAVMTS